jgi:hypothetical protein
MFLFTRSTVLRCAGVPHEDANHMPRNSRCNLRKVNVHTPCEVLRRESSRVAIGGINSTRSAIGDASPECPRATNSRSFGCPLRYSLSRGGEAFDQPRFVVIHRKIRRALRFHYQLGRFYSGSRIGIA